MKAKTEGEIIIFEAFGLRWIFVGFMRPCFHTITRPLLPFLCHFISWLQESAKDAESARAGSGFTEKNLTFFVHLAPIVAKSSFQRKETQASQDMLFSSTTLTDTASFVCCLETVP
jgi:hypothetical protein